MVPGAAVPTTGVVVVKNGLGAINPTGTFTKEDEEDASFVVEEGLLELASMFGGTTPAVMAMGTVLAGLLFCITFVG